MTKPLLHSYRRSELSPEKRFEILRNLRSKTSLNAKEISLKLNVSHQTVRTWLSESNKRQIPMSHLKDLCQLLGYDLHEDFL